MADMLATEGDLQKLIPTVGLDTAKVVLEAATAVVQDAAGQRIVRVVDDVASILGTIESWLQLPQQPVVTVTAVALDGAAVTDYKHHGSRLWRREGWQANLYEPSTVEFTYTHGYASTDQKLQLARSATWMLAKGVVSNPTMLQSESLGDYSYAYQQMAAQMEASPNLQKSLRRAYGIRAGLVRIGGS
ncbi:hypothetical protein [Kibdelosporangium phytohabitans]|uniref:Uncharacterized protein n=1 Tax=Kibdelosporangium phytohabitans TaxID=860235 RepID=A0A0N7F2V0_9PSEU|nr:hypothetical protein [Kibdelosporangium phytohabitans]ALG06847.1 hypothetical protein AOZ06_07800 [Kibdelosporangium phytohabitans]MBE1468094.1 hypothetical protein [Kibdelosporangium phytohabitans]